MLVSEPTLTQQQMQVWAAQKLYPDLPLYNLVVTFTIEGTVSPASFRQAFQTLLNATDTLRTVIEEINGLPRRRILSQVDYSVPLLDFSEAADPQSYFNSWLREQTQTGFDLSICLFDTALVQMADNHFIWYLKLHHLVADGWSFSVLYRRLQQLYEQIGRDQPVDTPAYPQFETYLAEETQYLASEQYQEDEHYWQTKQAVQPQPAPLKLYGRPLIYGPGQSHRVVCPLGPERTAAFKALAEQPEFAAKTTNVALYNIFLGLLTAFLCQIGRNHQLAIGTAFANRTTEESRLNVGLFMKVVPLLLEVDPADTLLSLIKKIQVESTAALKHNRYPVRNSAQNPYHVIFNFHNRPRYPEWDGASVRSHWVHTGYDDVALSVQVQSPDVAGDNFELYLDFKEDVFNSTEQQLLVSHFLNILDSFLVRPDRPLSELSVQTGQEWHRMLIEWNQTGRDFPQQSVQQLFETQVMQTPDAPACIAASVGDQATRQITFEELNRQANQLAHYLQRSGTGSESIVAIYMDRSVETVVAIMAVLKAGAAFLPLDTAYPAERLRYMLADSQVSVLLTARANLAGFPDLQVQRVICLEDEAKAIARQSQTNPAGQVTQDNLAYVLYTSGSTGRPKGILGTHQGIVNRLAWMWREYPFAAGEVAGHKTSLNFIDAIWELFGSLLKGVPTLIIPEALVKDPRTLVATLAKYQVTRLWLVPSLLQTLLEVVPDLAQRLPHLTFLVTTGEAIAPALYLHTQAQMPQVTLYNVYGTSEVWDAAWYAPEEGGDLTRVPIGRPLDNVETYIFNEQLQPVPIGVPGQLYVGGAGLARGYLNRPGLTAGKFIPHPYTPKAGARLYATGDLARYRPDSNIEYLGRLDHQVKLRGYRIDLGEIESVLNQHPAVSQGAVMLYSQTTSQPGEERLVAYVAPQGEQTPDGSVLRTFLRSRLPEYMIPSDFIALPGLPLTPSAKINRHALPDSARAGRRANGQSGRAETPLERQLLRIWEEVFQIRPLSIHDDFFRLGGHSLLAVRLFAEIERMTGFKLPLTAIFRARTVMEIAQLLRRERVLISGNSLVPIRPDGSRPPLFCIHGLFGGIFFFYDLVHHLEPHQPVYGLQSSGFDEGRPTHDRIGDMAAHYIQAMRTVQPEGPFFLCGFSLGGIIAFEIAHQLQAQGHQVALVALLDTCVSCLPNYLKSPLPWPVLIRHKIWSVKKAAQFHWGKIPFLSLVRRRTSHRPNHRLNPRECLPTMAGHPTSFLQQMGAIETAVNDAPPVPDYLEGVITANLTAVKHYIPQTYSGKVTLFRATSKPVQSFDPLTYGWAALVVGGVEVLEVPGTHLTLLKEPHVQHLAASLSNCINRTAGSSNGKASYSTLSISSNVADRFDQSRQN
jgi:aspartate racemase